MLERIEMNCCILTGPLGWASCSVKAGEQCVEIGPFSHALTDGLDNLVRATVSIVCDDWGEASFSMDDEPEPRWHWQLKRELRGYGRERRPELDVVITRIDDLGTMAAVEVFCTTCDPDEFGRAVLAAMRRMMSTEPRAQLLNRWGRFPVRAIAALEAALAISSDTVIL